MYAPRFFVSSQQRFGVTDIKAPWRVTALGGQTVLLLLNKSVLQLSVTALFIEIIAGKSIFEAWGHVDPKTGREVRPIARGRGREQKRGRRGLQPLFLCVSVPGPVLCKLGRPGVLLVLPEVLTPVLGPSFVLFPRAFLSRSFSHPHFGLFFPILTT